MKNPISDKGLGIAEVINNVENLSDIQFPSGVDNFNTAWREVSQDEDYVAADKNRLWYLFDANSFLMQKKGKVTVGLAFLLDEHRLKRFRYNFAHSANFLGFRITRNKQ